MTTPTPAELAAEQIIEDYKAKLSELRSKFSDDMDEREIDPESEEGANLMAQYETDATNLVRQAMATTRKAAIEECVKVLHGHHGTRMEKATYPLDQYTIGNLDATIELANKLQSLLK
jgi:hypothetical protein